MSSASAEVMSCTTPLTRRSGRRTAGNESEDLPECKVAPASFGPDRKEPRGGYPLPPSAQRRRPAHGSRGRDKRLGPHKGLELQTRQGPPQKRGPHNEMRASFGKKTTTSKPSETDGTMQNRCRPPSGIGIRTYRYLQPKQDPPAPPFTSDTTHPPEAIRTGGFLFSGAAAATPPQNLHNNRTNVNRTNNETFIGTTHLCRPHAPWRMQQRRRHHRTARARHHARTLPTVSTPSRSGAR